MQEEVTLSVSEFIAVTNQTLEYAYPSVTVVGEVASFKVNQQKYVFFDVKDEGGSVGCFMMAWQLRVPLEDGMKVAVTASPKLTTWGKFSLTVRTVRPMGDGSLKRAFELLKQKLEKEGLFDAARKRPLPLIPAHVGVISSTQAAGYADFMKIVEQRWRGVRFDVAHVQVQGDSASQQIIQAIGHFNQIAHPPEVLVIIRGGGSADDLAAFNDEPLVRAIATSRMPTLVGVGHEVDVSLADMVADVRAATPSNAAQLLVPDREEVLRRYTDGLRRSAQSVVHRHERQLEDVQSIRESVLRHMGRRVDYLQDRYDALARLLQQCHPRRVLRRGYALITTSDGVMLQPGTMPQAGDELRIETATTYITTGVKYAERKETDQTTT